MRTRTQTRTWVTTFLDFCEVVCIISGLLFGVIVQDYAHATWFLAIVLLRRSGPAPWRT